MNSQRLNVVLRIAAALLFLSVTLVNSSWAQTLTTLYTFVGAKDGSNPQAKLTMDARGNLYGTTPAGGVFGFGAVFELSASGKQRIIYSFTGGLDGATPVSSVVIDAKGNLYGTTLYGGANHVGTVFKVTLGGKESVLHTFSRSNRDGFFPSAGLVLDAHGNLFGTTSLGGGNADAGTIFEIPRGGREKTLYNFAGNGDGGQPSAGLILDSKGNLFGTTASPGTVFELMTNGRKLIVHHFTKPQDGAFPQADLIRDEHGTLYGTTFLGGTFGRGTVFQVTRAAKEKVFYSFTGGADGDLPLSSLVLDVQGNLYGTTRSGGAWNYGTIFKVALDGTETVLYSFTGGTDGRNPEAGLLQDAAGDWYGTTLAGGAFGAGTVFKLNP